jgi:alkylated DNA repair dioxygenase AlkB
VAWHSDDEPELGAQPIIASISLGAVRKFELKNKLRSSKKMELSLAHGSLLLMTGDIQRQWLHQIPKCTELTSPRINITFRKVSLS